MKSPNTQWSGRRDRAGFRACLWGRRRSPPFGNMKVVPITWQRVVSLVAIGLLVLVWARMRSQSRAGKEWLVVSVPTIELRTDSQSALFAVSFVLSNAGPRTLEFGRSWLECRKTTRSGARVVGRSIVGLPQLSRLPRAVRRIRFYPKEVALGRSRMFDRCDGSVSLEYSRPPHLLH